MSRESSSLRAKEIQFLYRLLGECCELGADPLQWRIHMLAKLNKFFGAVSSICIDGIHDAQRDGIGLRPQLTISADQYSPTEQEVLTQCIKTMPLEGNPLGPPLFRRSLAVGPCAIARIELLTNQEWEASPIVRDYFAAIGWFDMMLSTTPSATGFQCICFAREKGAANFSRRFARLLNNFVSELATISDVRLARMGTDSLLSLPSREREVLSALSEGDDEKQVALRLGITRNTVHEYVRRLLNRYGVSSRSELLIRAARQIYANRVAQELSEDNC